jgi:hypothetical protein
VLIETCMGKALGKSRSKFRQHSFRTGALNMSTRIAFVAFAALVTALSFQGTVSARSSSASNRAIHRLQASDDFGSISDQTGASIDRSSSGVFFGGKALGRDPDPNVRLELLRDKDLSKT